MSDAGAIFPYRALFIIGVSAAQIPNISFSFETKARLKRQF